MSKDDSSYSWDDVPMSLNTIESSTALFTAYRKYREELSNKDIDSQLSVGQSRDEFLATLALESTETSSVLFRKNASAHETKVQAWLNSSISQANKLALSTRKKFSGITEEDIRNLAHLSASPERIIEIPQILAEQYGIILVIRPGYPAMKMDGCALILSNGSPMIGISLRYNRYDNFWFTLIHELSHVHLHADKLNNPIIDNLEDISDEEVEVEANAFARGIFVPRREWRVLYENRHDEKLLDEISAKIGTHPEILAGLIRHASSNYKLYPNHHGMANPKRLLGLKDE